MGLVYHYTSPIGVLGILQNKTLRFTDCEFLNDPVELAHCYELYNQAWVEVCRELGMPEERIVHEITAHANPYECIAEISDAIGVDIPARYYAFSTSLAIDSVVMWSSYASGDARAGYALGFDQEVLEGVFRRIAALAEGSGLYAEVSSGKVMYEKDEQLTAIKSLIRDYLVTREAILSDGGGPIDQVVATEVARDCHWTQISAVAPFIKRPEFVYEQEYRFVIKAAQIDSGQRTKVALDEGTISEQPDSRKRSDCSVFGSPQIERHFREGFAGAMTPFLEVKLGDAFVDVLQVIMGNSYHDVPLIKDGLVQLIQALGFKGTSVEMSDVLLRK